MAAPRPSPPPAANPVELEVTVLSAKHLKNVNWRHGDLKPYVVVYLDPDRRVATKPDESGTIKPIWNERLILPLPHHDPSPLLLTLDIFHSKPSETPKPLIGTARSPLKDLIEFTSATCGAAPPIRTLELRRPSGRPQGKIRIKITLRERPCPPEPNYHLAPSPGYYYSSAPPPPLSVRDYRSYSPPPPPVPQYNNPFPSQPLQYPYHDPYYSSTSGYYSAPQVTTPARPYYDRSSGYTGPSAPVDYSSGPSSYEQKAKGGRLGMGAGLAVGAVTGALGGLVLQEGLKYEEEKVTERVESDLSARDDYSDYRADY